MEFLTFMEKHIKNWKIVILHSSKETLRMVGCLFLTFYYLSDKISAIILPISSQSSSWVRNPKWTTFWSKNHALLRKIIIGEKTQWNVISGISSFRRNNVFLCSAKIGASSLLFRFSGPYLSSVMSQQDKTRTNCPYAANCNFLGYIFQTNICP